MKYYEKKNKKFFKIKYPKLTLFILAIFILFNSIMYAFNRKILPAVMKIAQEKLKREATDIINETALEIYSKDFSYSDIMIVEKDTEGNITMLRADTVKLNYLASKMALACNDKIAELNNLGLEVPLGYMTENLVFHNIGPKVDIKMNQIGSITKNYESIFESAGINQTRHKIYLNIELKLNVVLPLRSEEVEIFCQIPISETIIVGKIPNTAIDLGK